MGSKRTKKIKQELDILSEANTMKKINENDTPDPITSDVPIDNNSVIQPSAPKAPKRKKKSDGTEVVPKRAKKTNSENEGKKVKVRKKKIKSENEENKLNGENRPVIVKKTNPERKREIITWPDQDIFELINRMETNIPETDAMAYRSRVEKLNWDNVAFKTYNAEACKKTWLLVQKRIRRFRLLREVLNDAKEWISAPKIIHRLPRPKKHPDMPRRPLSSYLLFYLKKKDEIISENPGLDGSDLTKTMGQIFKNLPPEKKETYEKMAASNREEYLEKLKIFFEKHPEYVPPQKLNLNHKLDKVVKVEKDKLLVPEKVQIPTKIEKEKLVKMEKPIKVEKLVKVEKPVKVEKVKLEKAQKSEKTPRLTKGKKSGRPPKINIAAERPPKKCQTPFGLYLASELTTIEPGTDKGAFREKCKQQYREMPDQKKVCWINLAEQDLIRYEEEVKAYKLKYPDWKVQKVRSILTKREKASKERAAGKPSKPPNSAYALFSRVMLQSGEIKAIHPKDRMNYIASKWKTCTEEEQNSYRDQVVQLMDQYKQQYQNYVDSLPEEEKKQIITQAKRKKVRISRSSSGRIRRPRKRKPVPKTPPAQVKFTEPEQPPISACKYFATQYIGEADPLQAWKALPLEEKRKYEEELVKKKQAYIVEFEKFLKSLTKEELEAFSKSRQQQVQSDDEESSECSSDSEGDEGDDEEGGPDGEEHNEENGEVHNNEARASESE